MLAFAAIAETSIAGLKAASGPEFFVPLVTLSFVPDPAAVAPATGARVVVGLTSLTLAEGTVETVARRRRRRQALVTV